MIADRLKELRNKRGITQSDLARKLGVTRSCVNAWEMGISVPSTQYIVELSVFFKVSSDYLLEIPGNATVNVDGLTDHELALIVELIDCLRKKNQKNQ